MAADAARMTEPRTTLDPALAGRLASIAIENLGRDYPHKLDHVMTGAADAVTPQTLHPAFHGSYDWHSCVHMHWLLARLRRRVPDLPEGNAIDAVFDAHFTAGAIAVETAYLARPDSASFERPYGWAWLLKLAAELHAGGDPSSVRWSQALLPLADAFAARFVEFLPRTRYPVRHGVHSNSAFGLAFALDYAREARVRSLEASCAAKAREWFADDRNAPARWEPSGVDFLSPVLMEAELMRRVLDPSGFAAWLDAFLPSFLDGRPATLFTPAQVTDRSDPQLVHLDGLNLSRAWCLRGIAAALAAGDRRIGIALAAADAHLAAGRKGLDSHDFVGAHWLATFALLALDG